MKNGKISKKLLSVLLSLCMVFACITPVFAGSSAEMERKELSKWTFDSQAEVDALACDGGIVKTLSEDGMLKIEGGAFPYIYPFNGLSLISGKEYLVCFDAKAVDADTPSVILECMKNFEQQFVAINTETTSHFEYQFTAKSSDTPNLVPLNGKAAKVYYDNIYLYELTPKIDTSVKNKVIKEWTFDSQADVDSFIVDPGTKAYESGMVKVSGSGAYTYPFDGMKLTVGKEYIVSFKTKTATPGTGGYLATYAMYANGDIGFCNFDAAGNEAVYSNRFTAHSANPPYIVMVGASAYIDDIYLYEVTAPATIVASAPAAGDTVYPTNKIEIEFSDALSEDALAASSWTLTDGNGSTIAVSSVEKLGGKYTLHLAETTKNLMGYTLTFEGLKSIYNHPLVTTSLDFISYEGETLLYFPFSSAETSTWLYLQTGGTVDMTKFYNTDYYHSAPGSRWVEAGLGMDVTVKKGDGTDSAPEFIAGDEYTVSFWAKPYTENGQDASNVSKIRFNQGDRQYVGLWQFEGTDWQYFEATYTQIETGGLRYTFEFKDAGSPVKLYLDDLKITRKTKLADFTLTGSNPQNGSAAGILDSITVNFSQTPGASALDAANYTLTGGTQTVSGAKIIGNDVVLSLSQPLSENTSYSLSMNIKDALGRELAGNNTINFKTAAKVLYRNDLSTDEDFQRPVFKEYAAKSGSAALFDVSNEQELYIFQDNSYVNTPLEIGKSYTIQFKAAVTAEGNAQHFALVESDNSRFVYSIYDLSTDMKTYTVNFTATTKIAPFFRMYTQDPALKTKVLLDDIVLYTVPDELYIDEVKFFKDYGAESQDQIVDGYVTDGSISAVIENADNYSGKEQKLILWIALYENAEMVSVSSQDVTLADGESLQNALSAAVTVSQKADGIRRTIKGFIWDAETNAPMDAAKILKDF